MTTHAPITSFSDLGLPTELVGTLHAEGLTTPFPVQAAAIPDALAGRDLLGRGRTGSGKTLAFGLPLLARTAEAIPGRATPRKPHAVILAPTRELALQVCDALRPYAKALRLWLAPIVGGASYERQFRDLDRGAHVVVATPGRLSDLVERGAVDLSEVQIMVLDEADQMADTGFLPAVCELLDMVVPGGQRMLFSATLDNRVQEVVKRYLVDPVEHATDPAEASVPDMEHHVIKVAPRDKARIINEIAARRGRTVMFVRSRLGADNVADRLAEQGLGAAALHGGMTQGARNRTLSAFKDGHTPVLVATDVAARGIHVDGIDLVLHIDPASDHKDYLHRAGRTARAGSSGLVLTLALPHQVKPMQRLLRDAGLSVHPVSARPGDDVLAEVFGARDPEEAAVEHAAAEDARREAERAERQRGGGRSYGRRSYGDRGDRGPRRSYGDRDFGDRPRRSNDDRGPRREFGDRGSRGSYGNRDDRSPRREVGDRGPRQEFGDRGPRREFDDRGQRGSYGNRDGNAKRTFRDGEARDSRPRRESDGPRRSYDDRAPRRGFDEKGPSRSVGERAGGERRTFGNRREFGDRSSGRPYRGGNDRPVRDAR